MSSVCLLLACGRACSCVCVLACFCTYTFEAISVGIVPESRVALREGIQGAAVRAAQNQVEVEAHQASQQVSPPSRAVVRQESLSLARIQRHQRTLGATVRKSRRAANPMCALADELRDPLEDIFVSNFFEKSPIAFLNPG